MMILTSSSGFFRGVEIFGFEAGLLMGYEQFSFRVRLALAGMVFEFLRFRFNLIYFTGGEKRNWWGTGFV